VADFGKAVETILEHEGGDAFTDNPHDKGGPTKYGITCYTLGEWRKLGRAATADEVKGLTKPEAIAIYRARYWDVCRCEAIEDQLVAVKLFDIAVNCGPHTAIRLCQRAADRCQSGTVVIDGIMGPRTLEAIHACDPGELVTELVHVVTEHYLGIVQRDPTQRAHLRGWLIRARWPYEVPAIA
jgi:lysozyme family protein